MTASLTGTPECLVYTNTVLRFLSFSHTHTHTHADIHTDISIRLALYTAKGKAQRQYSGGYKRHPKDELTSPNYTSQQCMVLQLALDDTTQHNRTCLYQRPVSKHLSRSPKRQANDSN